MLIVALKLAISALVLTLSSGLLIYRPLSIFENWPAEAPQEFRKRRLAHILTARVLPKYLALGAAWILSIISLFSLPFCQNSLLRVSLSVMIITGACAELIALLLFGARLSPTVAKTIVDNVEYGITAGVGRAYLRRIAWPIAFYIAALAIFATPILLPDNWGPTVDLIAITSTLLASAGASVVGWATKGGTTSFPPPYRLLACAVSLWRISPQRPPSPVMYSGITSSRLNKIVLVVDESVRGDFLSINGHDFDTTPFLMAHVDEIANFRSAIAAANVSIPSRKILRFCVPQQRLHEVRDSPTSSTTIWQFARHAGFKTVHLDAFGTATLLSSGMHASERLHIDERHTFEMHDQSVRDVAIAEALAILLRGEERLFVLVEKVGTHVPYDRMYPATADIFGTDRSRGFDLQNNRELLKHYANALRWSVDGFFATLMAKPLPGSTVLIYTSDHGQSLGENGALSSHGSADPSRVGEVDVPLFAVCSDEEEFRRLRCAAESAHGCHSHFSIVPSLLYFFGYDADWIRLHFGPSLTDAPPSERLTLFGGRITPIPCRRSTSTATST